MNLYDNFNFITNPMGIETTRSMNKIPACPTYKMPADKSSWDDYLHKNKYMSSACSSTTTLDSSFSSLSDSQDTARPLKKNKKSYKLLREIQRLRDENTSLRNSVTMLKNDLRDIKLSRQDTDASHKKFYDEFKTKNEQLENDIEDRDDEIKRLKQEIQELRQQLPPALKKQEEKPNDQEEILMQDYINRRFEAPCHAEEEEEEEECLEEESTTFENEATSYIHQAVISKLSSERAQSDLDDLIAEYEPCNDSVINALSLSFTAWISSLLYKNPSSASKIFTGEIQTGIREFWETLLQHYTTDEFDRIELLHHIEHDIQLVESGKVIQNNFDRLVLMLYKYNVIDDDAVISWWQTPLETEEAKKLRKITTRFVEWVQDEEDDSEEEDDKSDSSSVASPLSGSDQEFQVNPLCEPCICQFDTDNNNDDTCPCSIKTPSPVIEKKKKSVRIAL